MSNTLGKQEGGGGEWEKEHAHNLFRGVALDSISVCLYASCLWLHYLSSSSVFTERTQRIVRAHTLPPV
jgi:hypothetical protein